MKRVFRWVGGIVAALVVLALAAFGFFYWRGGQFLAAVHDVPVETIAPAADEAALARGAHLAAVYCADCHGEDFGGQPMIDDAAFAVLPAPNLTRGRGGVGGRLDAAGWVRAVRHGVGVDGRALFIMPSEYYANFSREDLAAVVGHLMALPPVDRELPERRFGPVGRTLTGAGPLREGFPVLRIAHDAPFAVAPPIGETAEYGAYIARTFGCPACHGANLAGGPTHGAPEIFSPNLTPGGPLAAWSEQSFLDQARSRQGEHMPWRAVAKMTDEELQALWRYLASLPALPNNPPPA